MKHANAFTLVELLLAVALSALILTVAYQFFNFIQKAGQAAKENNEIQALVAPLYYTFLRDVESTSIKYAPLNVRTDTEGNQVLEFYANNCFFFPGICLVKYWVYRKVDSKLHYLMRGEYRLNGVTGEGIEVPLTSKVSKLEVEIPSSDGWSKVSGRITSKLIRIKLYIDEPEGELPLVFVIRSY